MAQKYKFPFGIMDQVDAVLWQLKNQPYSRRIMTNMYNFSDLSEMGLEPCAYSMTFNVTGNKLNGILNQRSQDILAANNWNVVQYAVLIYMLAQVSNLEPGELIHVISDAHIYDRHIPIIKELIKREPLPAPKFELNPEIKNFYDFSENDVIITDYNTHPQIKDIPIAI
jgi:thymidylate synthase